MQVKANKRNLHWKKYIELNNKYEIISMKHLVAQR